MKFLILVLLGVVNLFAIITIAPVDIGDKPGYSGMAKGSFETKRGNSEVDNYSAGVRAQYDNNSSYLIWGDLVFDYGEASGETNTNKSYAHIRLIHTFLDIKELNYEAFFQSETNEFTKVESKFLGGGGLRLHENMKKYGNLYFGLGGFFETIEYTTTVDKHENNLRMNSYASYTKTFNKTSKLSYVLYYQPNVENFSDYILSSGLELQVVLYKELYLSFVFYYDVDGEPAVGVEESDVTQKTSLIYKF